MWRAVPDRGRRAELRPTLHERRCRVEMLEDEVDRSATSASTMDGACRKCDHVPCVQVQRGSIHKIDFQRSRDNDEELIGIRMEVPGILRLERGQTQAALVDAVDHLVA